MLNTIWSVFKKAFPYVLILLLFIASNHQNRQLSKQIATLQAKLQMQQLSIRDLQKYNQQVQRITNGYREDISTLQDNYRYVKGSLENTLRNTKGNNRVIQQSVIDQLCSAYRGKYCIEGIYTNRTTSTLQQTSSKR